MESFTDAAQIIDEPTPLYQFIGIFKLTVTIATPPPGIYRTHKT